MADNIHVVPHFHWDREWYFTAEESKILLVRDMEEILTMLEENDSYPYFVLDGQTVVLEDYFSVKPQNRERVTKLIRQGKLIIGPWYTQTDEMVVGGESIVRNLLYGRMDCEQYGENLDSFMQIGYLPDSFGQTARLPQILNGFGISRCMFWRGTSQRMGSDKTEFYWRDGDSQVICQLMPLGYAIGKYLPTDPEALKARLNKYFAVLDSCATTDHILLPNGHDQMPIQKDIVAVMEQIEDCYKGRKAFLSRYEDLFSIIETVDNLDTLSGEFMDGRYMRVHRSIFSTRADIKSANTRIENKITNILEPLMSVAYRLGFSYEHGLIEEIWKEIMKNHAHDSIGCCCSDKVHKMIMHRFYIAEERVDRLIDFYKRVIVDGMPCDRALDKLTLFNLLPYDRKDIVTAEIITKYKGFTLTNDQGENVPYTLISSEVVDAGLIDRQIVHYGDYDPFVRYKIAVNDTIPSCGFKTYLINEGQPVTALCSDSDILENEYYRIKVLPNGSLEVQDIITDSTYQNVLMIEDGSDDGDEYDYSPLLDDFIVTSKDTIANTTINDHGLYQTARITYTLAIPKDLDSRRKRVCDGSVDITLDITLKKGSRVVALEVTADNKAKDHRVRILFPNNLSTCFSVADNQFGIIKRDVVDSAMEVWQEQRWSERPDSIYPFLSYLHCDVSKGLAVITNSVREYEIISGKKSFDTIAVTLFRSVGLLGKENLLRRPGRPSGIKLETPDSQLIGKQSYSLAFTTDIANVSTLAKEYLTPIVHYNKMPHNAMKLNAQNNSIPYNFSLLNVTNRCIIMSVLKKSERSDRLVIRMYNPSQSEQSVVINARDIDLLRLDEQVIQNDIQHEVTIGSNVVKTFGLG